MSRGNGKVRRVCTGPLCQPVPLVGKERHCAACGETIRQENLERVARKVEGAPPYIVAKVRTAIRFQEEAHQLMAKAFHLLDEALRGIQ